MGLYTVVKIIGSKGGDEGFSHPMIPEMCLQLSVGLLLAIALSISAPPKKNHQYAPQSWVFEELLLILVFLRIELG